MLFYYVGLQNYNVVSCYYGWSFSYIVLYRHGLPSYNATMVLCSSTFLYQRQSVITFTCLYNRHNPRRYLVHRRWPKAFPSLLTHVAQKFSSFSQCTKLRVFLTTQVIHHTYLYTHPTQSMHVFSSNADDPKRFLKIYNYYPDIVYF